MMVFSSSSSLDVRHPHLRDEVHRRRARVQVRHLVPWLTAAVIACAPESGAVAEPEAQSQSFATVCALKETKVITLIEDHGEAGDLPADSLGDAGLAMLRARLACYEGRVAEALALYDGILSLGPVVSLRRP
jgi:hypothetical protein